MVPQAGLGLDARALDSLRHEAARNPQAASRQAAVQFESLFMQMVMKSMREATAKADGSSGGQDNFTGMLDAQFARQFAGRPGGLAEMIEKQLTGHMRNLPPVSAENQAAAVTATPAAPTTAAASTKGASVQTEFMRKMLPHAQAAERATGVPASFILGQAALESGWGRGEIRHADGAPSFNLFGIKAGASWTGDTAQVRTTEYVDGQPVKQAARFRSYGSYAEAFSDYARLLADSPRYAGVVRGATTAESFAGGMQRAGYATDPQYASKLARTINHALSLQRATG
jgi:peptidoglycan hydrolase FlgJ